MTTRLHVSRLQEIQHQNMNRFFSLVKILSDVGASHWVTLSSWCVHRLSSAVAEHSSTLPCSWVPPVPKPVRHLDNEKALELPDHRGRERSVVGGGAWGVGKKNCVHNSTTHTHSTLQCFTCKEGTSTSTTRVVRVRSHPMTCSILQMATASSRPRLSLSFTNS